jgi:hypothetical protein
VDSAQEPLPPVVPDVSVLDVPVPDGLEAPSVLELDEEDDVPGELLLVPDVPDDVVEPPDVPAGP